MLRIIQILILALISTGLSAQSYKSQRNKTISRLTDTTYIDTLSIIPRSEIVMSESGRIIDTSYYKIIYPSSFLIPTRKMQEEFSSVRIAYRVFPISLSKEYYNKDQKSLLSPDSLIGVGTPRYISSSTSENPFGDNIETSGSITRGFSFGNNQDMVVSSALNLQISGKFSDKVMIEGAISDKATPLQPQGNTQKLQEFDRIYLKAYAQSFALQAGDVELKSGRSSFLKYSRNVQGIGLSVNNILLLDDSTRLKVAAAVAKGKFARNSFIGTEGNQGPYRLTGSEGETYIIVIAGSERVYIDGVLLTRGENNQYTIDYNTAELTFTPMMPITGNSRISVEFEYTEQSYARFTIASGVEQRINSYKVRVEAFSESDSKNQPFDQSLSSAQVDLLKTIGDNIDNAAVFQADSVDFNLDKILYEKKDTSVNGVVYSIFKRSVNPSSAYYLVNFSFLGEGKGNYILDNGSANGKVCKWIAPVNGKTIGSYEPIRILVTPKRKQMASISVEKELSKNGLFCAEASVSRNDINTYSSIDKKNDVGGAFRMSIKRDISRKDSIRYSWIGADVLYTSVNFNQIDRFRSVEFERDWNLQQAANGGGERDAKLELGYKGFKSSYSGTVQVLSVGEDYKGIRGGVNALYRSKKISYGLEVSSLTTDDSLRTTVFNRIRVKSELNLEKLIAGVFLEGEDNSLKSEKTKTLLPASFRWYQADTYIGQSDSLPRSYRISYTIRKDWKTPDRWLRAYSFSQDLGLKVKLAKKQNSRLNLYAGYRMFDPIDTTLSSTKKKENNILGRIEYTFTAGKGFISTNIGYEIGSGLEPKYLYYYIEVPAGQGVFTWNDYNGNGVKELDEFEIATFKDQAKYIRINLSSNQFITVKNGMLSAQIDLRPASIIRDTSYIATFISKFSNLLSFSTKQKNQFDDIYESANPLRFDAYDSSIVSMTQTFRNSLAYNRYNRAFGFEWISSGSINKQALANGYEIAKQSSNQINGWIGVSSLLSIRSSCTIERRVQESELFTFKNYTVKRYKPTLTFRFSTLFGLIFETGYEFEFAENLLGDESNRMHSALLDINYSVRSKSTLSLSSSISKVSFNGSENTPVEYELLKGFKSGTNSTWEVKYRRKISTYFEMDIGYSGRYISGGDVVHTGSMQVRAVF